MAEFPGKIFLAKGNFDRIPEREEFLAHGSEMRYARTGLHIYKPPITGVPSVGFALLDRAFLVTVFSLHSGKNSGKAPQVIRL